MYYITYLAQNSSVRKQVDASPESGPLQAPQVAGIDLDEGYANVVQDGGDQVGSWTQVDTQNGHDLSLDKLADCKAKDCLNKVDLLFEMMLILYFLDYKKKTSGLTLMAK